MYEKIIFEKVAIKELAEWKSVNPKDLLKDKK